MLPHGVLLREGPPAGQFDPFPPPRLNGRYRASSESGPWLEHVRRPGLLGQALSFELGNLR